MTEQPARHTVDTITSDALDALYEMLDAAQQTELARQLATAERAFCAAHLRATRLGSTVSRMQRAQASTILQARRWAARARTAEAALGQVRNLHSPSSFPNPDAPGDITYCVGCEYATGAHPCNTLAALDDPKEPTL
ncbi:hypothetical protein ACGFYY_25205 [Streptomyces sp. NPDC048331]|uniref:hypothetical protein n=1 Tax=Streptomyces sp. NPDC048331 TaxID=3365534 RepID=UPI00372350BC